MTQNFTIHPSIIGYKTHTSLSERADCSTLSLKQGPQLKTPHVTSLFRDATDPIKFFNCLKTEEQHKLFSDPSLDSKDQPALLKSLSNDVNFFSLTNSLAAEIRNPLLDNLYTNDELKEISPSRQVAIFHATGDIAKKELLLNCLSAEYVNQIFATLNSDTKKELIGALKADVKELTQLFNKLNIVSRRDLATYLTVENLALLLNEINLNTNDKFINLLSTSTFTNVFPKLDANKQATLLTLYATDHHNQLEPQFLANSLNLLPKDKQYSLFNTYHAGEAKQVELFELISDVNAKKSLIEELYASTLPKFLSHLNADQIKNMMALYAQVQAPKGTQNLLQDTLNYLSSFFHAPNRAITILNNIPSPETKKLVFNSLSAEHLTSFINDLTANEIKPLMALAIDASKQAQIFNLITSNSVKKELFTSFDKETQSHLIAQLNSSSIKGLFDLYIDDSTMQTNILSNLPNAAVRAEFFKALPDASKNEFAAILFDKDSLAHKFVVGGNQSLTTIEGAKQFVNKVTANWFSGPSFNQNFNLTILEGNPLLQNHTCTQQKIINGECHTTKLSRANIQYIVEENQYLITLDSPNFTKEAQASTWKFPIGKFTGFDKDSVNQFIAANLPHINGQAMTIDTESLKELAATHPGVEYLETYTIDKTPATTEVLTLLHPENTTITNTNSKMTYLLSVACSNAIKKGMEVAQCKLTINPQISNNPNNPNEPYGVYFDNLNGAQRLVTSHPFTFVNWNNVLNETNQVLNIGYQTPASGSSTIHYGKPTPTSKAPGFFDNISFELPNLGQVANSTLSKALPALLGIYTAVKCGEFAIKAINHKSKSLGQKTAAVFTAAAVGLAGLGLAVNRINAMS